MHPDAPRRVRAQYEGRCPRNQDGASIQPEFRAAPDARARPIARNTTRLCSPSSSPSSNDEEDDIGSGWDQDSEDLTSDSEGDSGGSGWDADSDDEADDAGSDAPRAAFQRFSDAKCVWPPEEGAAPEDVALGYMVVLALKKSAQCLSKGDMELDMKLDREIAQGAKYMNFVPRTWNTIRRCVCVCP
jgi:hypothetical protein